MFSSGLPMFYFIGFCFYLVFYWSYKVLLLKWYAKSVMFSDRLAMYPPFFIFLGVIAHVVLGIWFYSSQKSFGAVSNLSTDNPFIKICTKLFPGFKDKFKAYHSAVFSSVMVIIFMFVIVIVVIYQVVQCVQYCLRIKQ
jgi:hypothetical protein